MKSLTQTITSILGAITSIAGIGLSLDGCDSPKLYGPPPDIYGPPPDVRCCDEFNQPFYERCIKAYEEKGICIADQLRKETGQAGEKGK